MLQESHVLLEQGQTAAARHLLVEAVAESGDDEHAAALRVRLERHERADAASRVEPGATAAIAEVVPGWSWPRRSRTAMGAVAVLVAALVLVIGVTSTDVQDWVGLRSDREQLLSRTAALKLPMLSSADVVDSRANPLQPRAAGGSPPGARPDQPRKPRALGR
jgi:hypothetical protein